MFKAPARFKKILNSKVRNQKGMTLIEIMVVLAILGGLATVLIGQVRNRLGGANIRQAKIQISEYVKNLDMYYTDCGSYPTTEEGLEALVQAPASCTSWGPQPYIKKVNKDPWKNDLIYESNGASFTLKSLGADRMEGGTGEAADISSEDI